MTIPPAHDSPSPMARPKNLRGGRKPRTSTPATAKITVRLTGEERARIEDEAAAHETTPGALMRERGLRREPTNPED